MPRIDDQNHMQQFAANLELALRKYGEAPEDGLLELQRRQIRRLVSLETQFRRTLIDHPWGPGVYRDFVDHICNRRRNILAARPYFRERQATFTRRISGVLKRRRDRELYGFRFNWSFVAFVLRSRRWPAGGKIASLAREIAAARQELLEQNLPLAIHQARVFWSNTPRSHLSYMDIVQIQCQALLLAIDKFVPPREGRLSNRKSLEAYRRFRAVAIGIMARDRVNQYSETLVHYFPDDKLKLYRAHKAMRRFPDHVDFERVAEAVNRDRTGDKRTDAVEIGNLVTSASMVSADYSPDPEVEAVVDGYPDDRFRPDVAVEEQQAAEVMRAAIGTLPLREQKLLTLRGVRNDGP